MTRRRSGHRGRGGRRRDRGRPSFGLEQLGRVLHERFLEAGRQASACVRVDQLHDDRTGDGREVRCL